MYSSAPHLFVTLIGDVSHEPFAEVKYGFFLKALERKFPLVICDATLRGLPRFLNAIQVFSPDRRLWKERFYQNIPSFHLRSQKVAAALRQQAGKVDAILQIGVLYDACWAKPDIPSIIYTDYTSHLSSHKPKSGRSPHKKNDILKWLALEKQAFHRSAHICTRGQFVSKSITEDYNIPANKVTAIGGGVNFGNLPNLKTKSNSSEPTALFIGKDFYRKGGDLLLKAFSRVRQTIPNAHLVMVTEGLPSQGFDLSGVQIVNPTWDRAIIQGLYEKADCFVLPSRLETWGDVLLEAMSFALPCIGISGEAMGEIIQNGITGLVTPPEDIIALANALIQIMSNREQRERMGIAARQRIESVYTWDQVVKRLVPIIESTIQLPSIH
jgi:glycosyltransferase involved in cell wall biosynthesis